MALRNQDRLLHRRQALLDVELAGVPASSRRSGFIDKFRLGLTIFHASKIKDWKALEQIPVVDWLRRWSGRRTFEKIWLPLLRAKLGESYDASAAFIWATIQRMYAARRIGHEEGDVRLRPRRLRPHPRRFAAGLRSAGVELQRTARGRSDRSRPSGRRRGRSSPTAKRRHFDRVVVTAGLAARVEAACRDLPTTEHARLNGVTYQGIVCASLLLRNRSIGYYVTNITDDWVPFTAVIEMTALVDRPSSAATPRLPAEVRRARRPALRRTGRRDPRAVPRCAGKHVPALHRDDVLAFRVSRVRQVFAVPTLGYSERVPPMRRRRCPACTSSTRRTSSTAR